MSRAMRTSISPAGALAWTVATLLMATVPAAWATVTVSWVSPADGTLYLAPADIRLYAIAEASEGYTVSKVEFFSGSTLIGSLSQTTGTSYMLDWTNVQSGTYAVTAKATAIKKNSPDQTATTTPVKITVNARPVVSITSPAQLSSYPIPPPSITVNATASDSDGTIVKVEFYNDCSYQPSQLLATVTTPPYTVVWTLETPYWSDQTGKFWTYKVNAIATDNLGNFAVSDCVMVEVEPTIALTSPANGANFTAPAAMTLNAAISPADAPINKVQFYNGTTLIGEDLTAPYSISWENVGAGSYSLTAKAVFQLETREVASVPVTVTVSAVQARLHYIHADHLNTPRLVANAAGTTVWRWDQQEPFGVNVPDENPSGLGAFEFPLRFPGQYADKETNLHYNYFRDYDPTLGIYKQSDPIGLKAGLNTYAYVASNPVSYFDLDGLKVRLICRPVDGFIVRRIFDHCFVHVTCPAEGIDKTLSLFGASPYIGSTGHKKEAIPETYLQWRGYPDNPNIKNKYDQEIAPCGNNCCAYEKEVIARFNAAPSSIPYEGTIFNSNNFSRYLITSPKFCAGVPSDAPTSAPGLH